MQILRKGNWHFKCMMLSSSTNQPNNYDSIDCIYSHLCRYNLLHGLKVLKVLHDHVWGYQNTWIVLLYFNCISYSKESTNKLMTVL